MRLRNGRWQRLLRNAAEIDACWFHPDRQLPYAFAAEMASWPEPIDVIRSTFGLSDRWQRRAARAWQEILGLGSPPRPKTATIRWVKGQPVVEFIDDPDIQDFR